MGNYYSETLLIYVSDEESYFKLPNFSVIIKKKLKERESKVT